MGFYFSDNPDPKISGVLFEGGYFYVPGNVFNEKIVFCVRIDCDISVLIELAELGCQPEGPRYRYGRFF